LAIKGQALADFMVEWMEEMDKPGVKEASLEGWELLFDGSLTIQGAGAGIILVTPTGERLQYALQIHLCASNNVAEYEGLLYGLRVAASFRIRRMRVKGDSQLVIK
jgi:ribonuclease HI